MTTQPVASRRPSVSARGPARRRRIRAAAAIAAVAALIATGLYVAITTIGPDAATPTVATTTEVNPSAETLRDIVQSVAGPYGSGSAAGTAVNPSAQTLRELHESIAGQYGSQSEPERTVNPNARVRRELRHSTAGQYGPRHGVIRP
jgi:hypothetical protein